MAYEAYNRGPLDLIREQIHALETRVLALELTAVRRNGPVIEELRAFEKKVEKLATRDELDDALESRTLGIFAKAYAAAVTLAVFGLSLYEAFK